ncbi:Calcium-gated potassium channel MthK [uncultured archaeon]|nr:Calcium-gated potassium channel MthK [uncultured archaeon]
MVRFNTLQMIATIFIVAIFLASTALVYVGSFNLADATLLSFLNIIGAYFPPNLALVDARNPFILTAEALGTVGNVAFTIVFTTIFYQLLKGIDIKYALSEQMAKRASKHAIITPINGIGLELAARLREQRIPVVFVDDNSGAVRKAIRMGYTALHGDPAAQDTLSAAQASKALFLFTLNEKDITNTFITMAAKRANKKISVISRIQRLEDISKIEKAGAKRVILPEIAVGEEMSGFLLSSSG